jgi:hypothetical protein
VAGAAGFAAVAAVAELAETALVGEGAGGERSPSAACTPTTSNARTTATHRILIRISTHIALLSACDDKLLALLTLPLPDLRTSGVYKK